MSRKKMTEHTKEKITLGAIIGGTLICAACVLTSLDFGALFNAAKDEIRDQFSGVGNVVSGIGDAFQDSEVKDALGELESEFKENASGDLSALESALEGEEIINGGINGGSDNTTSPDNVFVPSASETTSKTSEDTAKVKGTIVRVKDGDTYVVNIDGVDTTVRLIGVDTPESVAPSSYAKENTEEGKTVSDIVKAKLQKDDVVFVEYDVLRTDRYGRTLAYLYFEDGAMIQDWLLVNGYAQVMTIQPNSKYADHFAELQHKAAENKIGLWNGFFEEKE